MKWQLAEAQSRLSNVLDQAINEGPQRIASGNHLVVVLSEDDYQSATGDKPSFFEYLTSANPDELDLIRDDSSLRDANL